MHLYLGTSTTICVFIGLRPGVDRGCLALSEQRVPVSVHAPSRRHSRFHSMQLVHHWMSILADDEHLQHHSPFVGSGRYPSKPPSPQPHVPVHVSVNSISIEVHPNQKRQSRDVPVTSKAI